MSTEQPRIELCVLGPLRIVTPEGEHQLGRNRRSTILAVLACRLGHHVSFDVLADELGTSRLNVMKTKSKLVAELTACGVGVADILVTVADGYRLDPTVVRLDAAELTMDVEGLEELAEHDPTAALSRADAALRRWGEPFQGVPPSELIDGESVRLESLHRRAELARAAALLGLGRVDAAETMLRAVLHRDPDDEAACHHLVTALGMSGRQSEALDQIRALNEVRASRGTEPSAALRALEDQLVRNEVEYRRRPVLPVRRSSRPVRRPVRFRLNTTCDFVGARQRLALLDALARKTRKSGSAVCFLEGVAGIGKTRLVEEWVSSSDTVDFRQCWIAFRASDDGPFRRVVQLLSVAVGLEVEGRGGAVDEVDDVRDARLIQALLDRSVGDPVMIVAEDLHWADGRSLDFLARLVAALNRQSEPGPSILLVVTSRPVDSDTRNGAQLERLRRGRVVSWLTVEALSELEVHQLVRGLGVPRPALGLIRTIRTVSTGNPLAVRALVSRLERTSALVTADAMTVLDPAMDDLPSVADIESLVSQQLDTFDEACHRVLLVVALAGDHAFRQLLDDLIGQPTEVATALDDAIGDGVLVDRGDRLEFDHPAAAQVMVNRTRSAVVRSCHARLARWLIDRGEPDTTTVVWIADHLARAGDEADHQKMIRFGSEAGDLAMGAAAWSDADRYLTAALEMAERLDWPADMVADLRIRVADAAFRDHQISRAAALCAEVARYGRQARDHELWGRGLIQQARCAVHDSDSFDATSMSSSLRTYVDAAERAVGVDPTLRAGAEQLLATLAWGQQDYRSAADHAERAVDLASSGADPLAAAQAALLAGLAEQGQLRIERSLHWFDRSIAEVAPLTGAGFRRWGASRAALSQWAAGRLAEARIQARDAADAAEEAVNWAEACLARTILAGVEHACGAIPEARAEADAALQLYHRSRYYWAGTILLPVRASLAVDDGDDQGLAEVATGWGRDLPLNVEILAALHHDDRPTLIRCRDRLLRRNLSRASWVTLPAIGLAADVALRLEDRELAHWCEERLRSTAMAEVRLVVGVNRLVDRLRARCLGLLGETGAAVELAGRALATAADLGIGTELTRAEADLARLKGR